MAYDDWKARDTTDCGEDEPAPEGEPCVCCEEPFLGEGLTCSEDCDRRWKSRLAKAGAIEADIDAGFEAAE